MFQQYFFTNSFRKHQGASNSLQTIQILHERFACPSYID